MKYVDPKRTPTVKIEKWARECISNNLGPKNDESKFGLKWVWRARERLDNAKDTRECVPRWLVQYFVEKRKCS
jgi:hypothetical protein